MHHTKLVVFLLRLSVASVFLYAAVDATIHPFNWVGYIPQIADRFAPILLLLSAFSFFQFVLAVWILSGWKQFFSASLAAITLLAIISVNWTDLTILFRDFAIFFAAVALAVGSR